MDHQRYLRYIKQGRCPNCKGASSGRFVACPGCRKRVLLWCQTQREHARATQTCQWGKCGSATGGAAYCVVHSKRRAEAKSRQPAARRAEHLRAGPRVHRRSKRA